MSWINALAALTPLIIASGLGLRWLGRQIWEINKMLATQNAAIRWQNEQFSELLEFDSSVRVEFELLEKRLSDVERYLESQSPRFERKFIIRGQTQNLPHPISKLPK
jgi:hypothetical protein